MPDPREQRLRSRVRMNLPVRVRQIGPPRNLTDTTHTLDVSRNGLLFPTREPYDLRSVVWVTMPYHPSALSPDPEFPATVVRVNRKPGGGTEIAVQFHNARSDQFTAAPAPAPAPASSAGAQRERRNRSRVRMALPIRVRHEAFAEESVTLDVSRAGVLFETARPYPVGHTVWVTMPYQAGSPGSEVSARVVRVVERENRRGVALHFGASTETRAYARTF